MRGEQLNDGLSVIAAGTGPPLVILPGFGRGADLSVRVPRSAAWSAAALSRGVNRTVHVIHRPLHPPAGMTISDLAGWHAAALRARFGAPVDIMGVSGGGVTGLQLALDHPRVVRRLVLCVAGSRVSEAGVRDLLTLVRREAQGRRAAGTGSRLVAHGPLRLLFFALYALPSRPRAPGEVALAQAGQHWDVTGRLGEIGRPVLVAGGGRDRLIPPDILRATAAGLPDARLLILPGRGHFTALYDPRLKPAIEAFLAEPDRPSGLTG